MRTEEFNVLPASGPDQWVKAFNVDVEQLESKSTFMAWFAARVPKCTTFNLNAYRVVRVVNISSS
jgi:hypothetical protein